MSTGIFSTLFKPTVWTDNLKRSGPTAEVQNGPQKSLPEFQFQDKNRVGLLVTSELDKALEECKSKVASISKECRARNRKFR